MPLYVYQCALCGGTSEEVRRIADRNEPSSHGCHKKKPSPMSLVIQPTMVAPDAAPYKALTGDRMGQEVRGKKQHREFLKRNRLVEVGDAPIRDTKQFRSVTKKGSIRRELKRAINQHLTADLKHGGLKERRG